jgi:hypothetical protein
MANQMRCRDEPSYENIIVRALSGNILDVNYFSKLYDNIEMDLKEIL